MKMNNRSLMTQSLKKNKSRFNKKNKITQNFQKTLGKNY